MKLTPCNLNVLVQFRSSGYQQINIQTKKEFILWEHLFPMKRPCVLASVQTYFPSLHLLRSPLSALLTKYLLNEQFQFSLSTPAIFNSISTEPRTKPASIRVTPLFFFFNLCMLFELVFKTFENQSYSSVIITLHKEKSQFITSVIRIFD